MAPYRMAPRAIEARRLPALDEDLTADLMRWLERHLAEGFDSGRDGALVVLAKESRDGSFAANPGDWLVVIPGDRLPARVMPHDLFIQLFWGPVDPVGEAGLLAAIAEGGLVEADAGDGVAADGVSGDPTALLSDAEMDGIAVIAATCPTCGAGSFEEAVVDCVSRGGPCKADELGIAARWDGSRVPGAGGARTRFREELAGLDAPTPWHLGDDRAGGPGPAELVDACGEVVVRVHPDKVAPGETSARLAAAIQVAVNTCADWQAVAVDEGA